jgi:uncharacterized protein YkwD
MAPRPIPKLVLATAAVACLALAPSAHAADLGQQRVVAESAKVPTARTATTSSVLASPATCPGQTDLDAPAAAQEEAMICMTNFARGAAGLGTLSEVEELDRSALGKAGDVLRCDSFSHFACGREFTYWIRASGYIGEACWHAGENLAWGAGELGSVRAIFRAWMASPAHRHNILGDYTQLGVALRTGNLEGNPGAQVWTAHFGSRCEG